MKKRVIAVVAASAATLCTAVTIAVGGTAGDPMLSKSYIDGAYTVQTISKAEEKITLRHDTLYQSAEETLKAKNDDYLTRGGLVTGDGTYQAAFSDLRVKEGDTVRIETGSGFLLLAGDVELSCTGNKTIDLSNGWEKGNGALTAGRLLSGGGGYSGGPHGNLTYGGSITGGVLYAYGEQRHRL